MAKIRVVFDADGTNVHRIKGHEISTQLLKNGRALVRVFNKKGKVVQIYHYRKVYYIKKDLLP